MREEIICRVAVCVVLNHLIETLAQKDKIVLQQFKI